MNFDWLSATHEERRTLYRHVKPLVDRRFGGNWMRFYADIPGHVAPGGHGDQDNFRAGRIARKRAAAIFDWIAAQYPAEAEAIAAALGAGDSSSSTWDDFLLHNGIYGRLHIARLDDASLNIVAFAARTRVERIRLGQAFCFALDSISAGTALALQAVGGKWYPLPLRAEAITAPVAAGQQFLPRDPATDKPLPLAEDSHLGTHSFAFAVWRGGALDTAPLIVGRPIAPDRLKHLARSLAATDEWAVHRLEVQFTP